MHDAPSNLRSAKWVYALAIILTVACIVIAGAKHLRAPHDSARYVLEPIVYFALFAWILARPLVRDLFSKVSPACYVVVMVLATLIILGQAINLPMHSYPFVNWTMYTGRHPTPLKHADFVATHRSGKTSPLIAANMSVRARTFHGKLHAICLGQYGPPEKSVGLYEATVHSLVRLHPAHTKDDPIVRVTAYECLVDTDAPNAARLKRTPLREVIIRD